MLRGRELNPDVAYHQTRFGYDANRDVLWKTLYDHYFSRLIRPDFHVLELGAGYGHFINHVRCAKRTAVDQFPLLLDYVQSNVVAKVGTVTDLSFVEDASVDFVFASNLFEHLTQPELASTLAQVRQKLKPDGSLNIVQPNYRLAYKEYFDDYTHKTVYSDVSLCDFLAVNGYRVSERYARFLPLSIKSRLPVWPWLIRLYLFSPWKPFAKQMFIRAVLER